MRLKRIYREAMFVRFDMAYEAKDEKALKKKELFYYPSSGMECAEEFRTLPKDIKDASTFNRRHVHISG